MGFDEYIPKGGWVKFHQRKRLAEKVKVGLMLAVLVVAYVAVGTLEAM